MQKIISYSDTYGRIYTKAVYSVATEIKFTQLINQDDEYTLIAVTTVREGLAL
jgi:hypothetical protein